MAEEVDLALLEDANESKLDFRRANGSPLVPKPDDPTKWLRYSRPSSYADCLDDKFALTEWRIWKAMCGVARSRPLQIEVNATKEEDKVSQKKLREKALDRGKANDRADMGTGLHAMTARIEDQSDVDFDPPEEYLPDLTAYQQMLSTFGLVSEMVEVPMVNDDFEAAGTADRIYRLLYTLRAPDGSLVEAGTLVLGDLKTGQKLDFSLPNFCVQMALYATGQLYDLEANRRLPTPPINQRWTLLVHMPFGSGVCKLLWVPIDTGLKGALRAYEVKQWRKQWKRGDEGFDGIEVEPPSGDVVDDDEDMERDTMAEMTAFAHARVKAISENDAAKTWLVAHWPEGLKTPKQGYKDPDSLVRCLDLLDECEKHFSLPFIPDPRRQDGVHSSQLDRSNERQLTK
jgi:hypothetical protein